MKRAFTLGFVSFWIALAAGAQAPGRRAVLPPRSMRHAAVQSLLERLPRVSPGDYARALAAAQARGAAGRADVLWIEFFYGNPAAKAQAQTALAKAESSGGPAFVRNPAEAEELDFVEFFAAYTQGQDRQMLAAALHLTQIAPDDVATELAVRTLSGQLDNEGRALLNAVPTIERALQEPLADPTTSYMLGRSLLAAVHAPGLALTESRALELAGRLPHWQLWGPFGKWQNLDFNQQMPIEKTIAATYTDSGANGEPSGVRKPFAFDSAGDAVQFPLDWSAQGVDFAVTYVHAPAAERVQLRLYSGASAKVEINGVPVIVNDRRGRYTAATAAAAAELAAGWNRIVVKLAGEANRDFDLMVRPAPAVRLLDAAQLPPGASLAGPPRILPAPETLASWSANRIQQHPDDAVALWVGGIQRMQDEDGEHARVDLEKASKLAPQAAPIWLSLAETYGNLSDASQSWAAAQVESASRHALEVAPLALRAYDRLGHVYESQGKTTQAARQFARCSGKGYADCDWSEFRLAASQRWLPEAETALDHALAESGSDWLSIANGLDFYSSIGDAAHVAQWQRVLAADPRAAGALGSYDLAHGRPARAAQLLQTAMRFAPSIAALRQQYLEALFQTGDMTRAEAAAKQAEADFPYDWHIAASADEIALRQHPAQGIQAYRQTDFDRSALRHQADFLAHDRFWMPWYHSAREILAHPPGATQYPSASSILVFDQLVNRINPDSSQDQYIHQIYRVLNAQGVAQQSDVTTIPQGSDLITIRTIKKDGRMLLPENLQNITDISMPGLEAGDYIEIEYVQHMPPSTVLPGALDNSEFFIFNSNEQPYHYSNYVVLTPPNYPLLVDQQRFPGKPQVSQLADGYTAYSWLVQKTRMLVTEPNMPNYQHLVPKVWVSTQANWNEISRYMADHLYQVRKVTPEMTAEADKLVAGKADPLQQANAVFNWVVSNIQPGQGLIFSPARQYFADRSGNRVATFLGLLSAAHVPYQLTLARMVTDNSSTKIPSLYQFQYPLVHVGPLDPATRSSDPSGWYDLNNDFAQLGYITSSVRGGQALVADNAAHAEFVHVPDYTSTLDGVVETVTGSVDATGTATLHLRYEFRGPNGEQVRHVLSNEPQSDLPQIYQQMLLANYPNGSASGGKIENMQDKQKPLILDVDATIPDFVNLSATTPGSSWNIQRWISPVGLLARYAQLPFRTHPLVIAGDTFEQTNVSVTLPASFGTATLPPAAKVENNFGSFNSSFAQTPAGGGERITFERTLQLRANLIPPSQYPAFRNFGETVDNQDRLQLTGTLAAAGQN